MRNSILALTLLIAFPAFADVTGNVAPPGSGGALSGTIAASQVTGMGGNCTNQFISSLSSAASPTCTTITSAAVDNSIAKTGVDINTANQVTATHLSAALPANQGGTGESTLTFPSATDTVALLAATQTFINKSITINQITSGTSASTFTIGSGGSISTSGTGTNTATSVPATGVTGTLTNSQLPTTLTAPTTGNAATATNMPYSGLTGSVPTWNQNTTGNAATATTAANLSGTPAVPNGTTATTQTTADNTTKLATDAFVVATAGATATTGNAATATALAATPTQCSGVQMATGGAANGNANCSNLPNPAASTLGGIESAAAVSHQWVNSISTSGVPALSQPGAADLASGALVSGVTTTGGSAPVGTSDTQTLTNKTISASSGAFTTLSASSIVSGSGFSTYLASPPAIGGTAAAAGTFTTDTATTGFTGTNTSGYTLANTSGSITSGTTGFGENFVGTVNDASAVDGIVSFANITCTVCTATSYLVDWQVGGSSQFKVSTAGVVTSAGTIAAGAGLSLASNASVSWGSRDYITSQSSGNIQLGNNPSATPVNQTLGAQGSRGGTDNNVAGATLTIQPGLGTGTGTAATLALQSAHVAASGTTQQTANTQILLGDNTVAMPNLASSSAVQTGTVCLGVSGNLTYDTTTTCLLSDGRMKENIDPLDVGLDEIMQLKPVSYDLKPKVNPSHLGRQVGLIAQDVMAVDPRLAATYQSGPNEGTPSGVRYEQMVALLVKGMQEQQHEINDLKAQVKQLTH